MKNTNFLTPQTPTASKRGLIAGIVAITAFIAVGVFSYLSFENSNGLPPAPPEVASQFQGKLDKDNMGILKKSKEDNKGEKNHKSEGEKVLKAGGFHWGHFENAKNLNDAMERADVKFDETKLVYLTYDSNLQTEGQWVTSPEKVYIGTKSIDINQLSSYTLPGGGLISSTKDLTVYGFNQGETPAKNFKCENLHKGWQITLAPKNANNDYSFYEDCVPSSIWEYDPSSKDPKRPFIEIPTAKLDTKVGNYLHWVLYEGLTPKKQADTKPLTFTIDNTKTPAATSVEAGTNQIKVAEFTINIDGGATINDIDVTMSGTATNADFNNLKMVIGKMTLPKQKILASKTVSFLPEAKIDAELIKVELYTDVLDTATVGNNATFNITRVHYSDKDDKEVNKDLKDEPKAKGNLITIAKPADTKPLTFTIDNTKTPAATSVEAGTNQIKVAEFTINIDGGATINDIDVTMSGTATNADFNNLKMVIGKMTLPKQKILASKTVSFLPEAKIDAELIKVELYTDVLDTATVGNNATFNITRVHYSDKDDKEVNKDLKDEPKAKGNLITIAKAATSVSEESQAGDQKLSQTKDVKFAFTASKDEVTYSTGTQKALIGKFDFTNDKTVDINTVGIKINKKDSLKLNNVVLSIDGSEFKADYNIEFGGYIYLPNKSVDASKSHSISVFADVPDQTLTEAQRTDVKLLAFEYTTQGQKSELLINETSFISNYENKKVTYKAPQIEFVNRGKDRSYAVETMDAVMGQFTFHTDSKLNLSKLGIKIEAPNGEVFLDNVRIKYLNKETPAVLQDDIYTFNMSYNTVADFSKDNQIQIIANIRKFDANDKMYSAVRVVSAVYENLDNNQVYTNKELSALSFRVSYTNFAMNVNPIKEAQYIDLSFNTSPAPEYPSTAALGTEKVKFFDGTLKNLHDKELVMSEFEVLDSPTSSFPLDMKNTTVYLETVNGLYPFTHSSNNTFKGGNVRLSASGATGDIARVIILTNIPVNGDAGKTAQITIKKAYYTILNDSMNPYVTSMDKNGNQVRIISK